MHPQQIASDKKSTVGPLSILGLDAVRFFVSDHRRARQLYQARLDFDEVARSTGEASLCDKMDSVVLQAGDVRLMFSAPLSKSAHAARYLQRHPEGVCELFLRVQDVDRAWQAMTEREATFITDRLDAWTETGRLRHFTIATPLNDLDITLLERPDGPFSLPGLCQTGTARAVNPFGITGIDHITSNLRMLRPWIDFLRDVLDFEPYWEVSFHTGDIESQIQVGSGLRSVVMWEPYSGLKLANNEPLRPHFERSQVAVFCDDNGGPGVQHLALSVGDIIGAVTALRRNVEFVPTPDAYYDMLPERLKRLGVSPVEALAKLRELNIQLDGNDGGYLLQIFMKSAAQQEDNPIAGPFFLELIQRAGAKTFGEGNFRALFEAIEREQPDATAPLSRRASVHTASLLPRPRRTA